MKNKGQGGKRERERDYIRVTTILKKMTQKKKQKKEIYQDNDTVLRYVR